MTRHKSKKECEAIFVDEILKDKIEWYATTYERGHYYWCFQLSGCQRYWTDLSKESCRKLGISEKDGIERRKMKGGSKSVEEFRKDMGYFGNDNQLTFIDEIIPEKKLQTPSCLTNPERRDELLERYKEGDNK